MASLSAFGLFVVLVHIVWPSKCHGTSDALMNIPARLVALEQTVAIIEGKLQLDRSSCKRKSIPRGDIVADISQGRFAIAKEKMLALDDTQIVTDIVRGMSANSDNDFGVLVDLAKGLNNTALKSRILLNLYHQARETDNISTKNLIALAKCLSGKQNGSQHERVIGINSFKKLLEQITESTITTFVDALRWQEDYQANSEVRDLAVGIAEWKDVSEKVMIALVSRVFGTVNSKKIFKAVSNHTDAWQTLVGVDALISRLTDTDPLKNSLALAIASHLNEIVTRRDLNSTVQDYARRLNDKIPDCIVKLASLTNGVLRTVDRNNILKEVCNHTDAWQSLLVMDTFIEWLKDTDLFKGSLALDIASHLNEFVTRSDLNSTVQDYAQRLMNKIPECIRNLTTSTRVCIWNKHKDAFWGCSFGYSQVVWHENGNSVAAKWQQQRKQEKFIFRNVYRSKRVLRASNEIVAGVRLALADELRECDDMCEWIIEPAGDSCFLKSSSNNEYLFVSDLPYIYAGTKAKPSDATDDNPEIVWKLVSC